MAFPVDIYLKATDRSAAGFVPVCAAGLLAFTGENPTLRHRTGMAADGTPALVARCVL